MEINYTYIKKRGDFGKQPIFCEQGPDLCDSIHTNKAEFKNYILRNPVHRQVQNAPCFSHDYINTIRAEYSASGVNHAEGGWPKDVNINDIEATQRYRRREEKDDDYIHCVMSLAPGMEHYIMQNNAIDMYRTYYAEMMPLPKIEKNSVRTVNEFRDKYNRPVSSISWLPEAGHMFAVSYSDIDFYRNPHTPNDAYLWDTENANAPVATFIPEYPMLDLQFNVRGDGNILAGGLVSGQVVYFDRRVGGRAVGQTPPHVSHRDMARKVIFIHSKSNMELFSGGPDGCLKWWDLRNLSNYTDHMIIDVPKTSFDEMKMESALGISVMEYEPTIPTRFMVGTENGLVVGGNRKGKTPMEKLPLKYDAHVGPIWSLQRNPFFPKNFLTVGDWTARIWSEECRESSIIWSPPLRYRVTAGEFSPVRLSLLLLCSQNGRVDLWDLLRNHQHPVLSMQISQTALTTLKFQDKFHYMACPRRLRHAHTK